MLEGIYLALDKMFGPMLRNTHPMWVVTVSGVILGAFFVLLNYFLVDQEKMKRLQKMAKELQEEFKKARESGDEKKLRKLQQKQLELLRLQNEGCIPQAYANNLADNNNILGLAEEMVF